MVRRFSLVLPDEVYDTFLRCFPDYGDRTKMLRRCVHRLIERAKSTGQIWNNAVTEVADSVADEQENK